VREQQHAENGEIVAAMIEGEATVKIFRRDEEKKQLWLLPANSAYLPIPADDVDILGKVVTVLRSIYGRSGRRRSRVPPLVSALPRR